MFDLYSTAQDHGFVFSNSSSTSWEPATNLLVNGIPTKFPNLRWGMIESTLGLGFRSSFRELNRRMERRGVGHASDLLRENNMFIACQADDDLTHVPGLHQRRLPDNWD